MTASATSVQTKTCPQCAEEIKEAARVCHYCGQRFEVARVGYCTHCHEVVPAGEEEACSACGAGLEDVHIESKALGEPGIAAVPEPAVVREQLPAAPPADTAATGTLRTVIVPSRLQRIAYPVDALVAPALGLLFLVQYTYTSQAQSSAPGWKPPREIFVATRDIANGYQSLALGSAFFALAIVCWLLVPWRHPWRHRLVGSSAYRARVEAQRRRRKESQKALGLHVESIWVGPVLFRRRWFRTKLALAAVLWVAGVVGFVYNMTTWKVGFSMELGGYAAIALLVAGAVSVLVLLLSRPQAIARADKWGVLFPAEETSGGEAIRTQH